MKVNRLKYLARINERTLGEETDPERVFRYIDIESVGQGKLVGTPETLTFAEAPSRARRLVAFGDTIVSTVRTYLRATLPIRESGDDLVVSTGFAVVSPDAALEPRFLGWALQSDSFIHEVASRSVGVSYPAISPTALGDIPIHVPGISAQWAIADYLDRETARLDTVIDAKRRMIEILALRSRSRLAEVFAPTSAHEETMPLRALLRPRQMSGFADLEVLSVYREFGVVPKSSREGNHNRTPEDLGRYQRVTPGDVVINKMKAWQGSLGVSEYEGIVSPDYLVCSVTAAVDRRFLHSLLRSPQLIAEYTARSSGIRPDQWRLYWEDLKEIRVAVPDVDDQVRIGNELEAARHVELKLIERIAEQLDRLAEQRQALITAAVTGQIPVRGAA